MQLLMMLIPLPVLIAYLVLLHVTILVAPLHILGQIPAGRQMQRNHPLVLCMHMVRMVSWRVWCRGTLWLGVLWRVLWKAFADLPLLFLLSRISYICLHIGLQQRIQRTSKMKTGMIININIETSNNYNNNNNNNNNNNKNNKRECIAAATGKLLSVHDAVARVRGSINSNFAQNMMQRHCCTGTRMWYHSWCHVVVFRIAFVVVAHLRTWCLPEQDPLHIGNCMRRIGMQTYACHILSYPIISCHAHVPSIFMHFREYLLISWVKGEAILCQSYKRQTPTKCKAGH